MAPRRNKKQLQVADKDKDLIKITKDLTNIKGALGALQTRMETLLGGVNDGDLKNNVKEKFGYIEGTIDDLTQVITPNSLRVRRERRLNELVTINKLPLELFTYIILLAKKSIFTNWKTHPYLSYTWVCHHWRNVLIQSPIFWTLIQPLPRRGVRTTPMLEEFYDELFQRAAKSSKLDVIITSHHHQSSAKPQLEKLFAERSSCIRNLWLYDNSEELIRLVLSGRLFSSLQGFVLRGTTRSLPRLLPILTTSDHLETLDYHLRPSENLTDTNKDQLASIFSRIRNLSLTLYSSELVQLVLVSLHNSARLQSLRLNFPKVVNLSDQVDSEFIFPELQFLSINRSWDSYLMDHIQAPKISSLNVTLSFTPVTLNSPIINGFDFSSIKYLWIQDEYWIWNSSLNPKNYSILGTKERMGFQLPFSGNTNILFGDYSVCESPRNYFRLVFPCDSEPVLREALSSVIPQLTNLVELHLEFLHLHSMYQKIIPEVPSIQKLYVNPGNRLISLLRFLSNPSRCPQLKHLSCSTECPLHKHIKGVANNIGKSLTKCLISRQDASPNDALKYIVLWDHPPLPNNWLNKLQKLGANVTTFKRMFNLKLQLLEE
ncbi:hypothetical protein Clacol_009667 [Clathrus columnatus]|uniref:F-box domain-containing protein n=1 Tax=Clathrus columnatus TaxID=1419009 RepID=A0AAV5AL60_9AGAM|nr:hypothetical protein Clacol_009667 [Clathrus columnatus]